MTDKYITEIHLQNFKGFRAKTLKNLNNGINIFVGDNDTGKSTVLTAIDLVLGCATGRVESIGLEKLLNRHAVSDFLKKTDRKYEELPELEVDIFLNDIGRSDFEGEQNISRRNACGIHLLCRPNEEVRDLIEDVIGLNNPAFPYEYYSIEIKSFSGKSLSVYKKILDNVSIDNTKISNEYATKSHIQSVYKTHTEPTEQNQLKYDYRNAKNEFSTDKFGDINAKLEEGYEFQLKSDARANLESDLIIQRDGVDLDSWGVGSQCFVRTQFALSKKASIDIVCLEEPENHLSEHNMRKLISEIKAASQSQLFIATYSSLVTSRLDLRNALLFPQLGGDPISLKDLPPDTAEYFIRAPDSSVLEYAMSAQVILVEGDAEYMLMSGFYEKSTGSDLNADQVNVISVGGISFPRYLDIGRLLNIKTAVVTDNDKDCDKCISRYEDYKDDKNIRIFVDPDSSRYTFEVCLYLDNEDVCSDLFGKERRSLTVQDYMLNNKSKAAYELAVHKPDELEVPRYIKEASSWIKG